ncbi:class I SAM-dependent methyltransferase [Paenibacillus jiagnxiensis]|uniref:class I SAM-dependent methyltransferase n=1 Tax=Paenibacillus jiagnxiensis TaxID=3228926 RepID=UPI0033BE46A7
MQQADFEKARKAEASYHDELYSEKEILEPGSWMSKPVPVVMEMLERLLRFKSRLEVLDLGCGAGRNAIPVALRLRHTGSTVTGLDLLEEAVEKLQENAQKYKVEDMIRVEKGDAEHTPLSDGNYDYMIACGCLEHVSSEQAFIKVLERMKAGTAPGGIHCITMNTGIEEIEADSDRKLKPLIELNLPTDRALTLFRQAYKDWNVLKQSTVLQSIPEEKYDKPTQFRACSVIFAAQKTG